MTAYEVGRESSNSVLVNVINVIGFQMSQRNAINGREKKNHVLSVSERKEIQGRSLELWESWCYDKLADVDWASNKEESWR